jgi:outer membrane protein TolC
VGTAVVSDTKTSKVEFKKKFSYLGTEVSLPYSYYPSTSNSVYARIPEGHNVSLGFSLNQPLIKPFYSGYFAKNHQKAHMELKLAHEKHGEEFEKTLQKAIQLYLEVIQAFETQKVKELSKQLAEDLFEKAKKKESLGAGSFLDRMEAESKLQRSIESLLTSQMGYDQKKQDFAMYILADPDKEFDLKNDLDMLERPPEEKKLDQEILLALSKRPELRAADISLEIVKSELQYAEADRLPSVNLNASQTYKGLSDSFSSAQDQVQQRKYSSTSFALKFEMPMVGYAAKGEKTIKSLRKTQEELKKQNIVRNTKLEIMKALRQVNIQWSRLAALRRVVAAEAIRSEGQTKKYEQGRIVIGDLNQALQDKENALLELLKARVNYIRALYDFSKARGTLLADLQLEAN